MVLIRCLVIVEIRIEVVYRMLCGWFRTSYKIALIVGRLLIEDS